MIHDCQLFDAKILELCEKFIGSPATSASRPSQGTVNGGAVSK